MAGHVGWEGNEAADVSILYRVSWNDLLTQDRSWPSEEP